MPRLQKVSAHQMKALRPGLSAAVGAPGLSTSSADISAPDSSQRKRAFSSAVVPPAAPGGATSGR
eukprot:CAMPEP_0175397126 /NCGR_PEP_ID=MMETSP0095-20121207/34815_1 /TAXON_ID=311494 /ORGANISM="Alexandrium monilatum, Strain CCMP3105" /LENGTH=64 /DNA_ID=CAMNT_0016695801 /DNA_START=20 /DNA_END=211 /DNA_ORIENTATION=-